MEQKVAIEKVVELSSIRRRLRQMMSNDKAMDAYFLSTLETLKDAVKEWISSLSTETFHGILLANMCKEVRERRGEYKHLNERLFFQFEAMLKELVQTEIADVFEVHYQMIVEKIEKAMDEVRDILDGTKKREVTNWWLNYIEEQADKVCCGFECVSQSLFLGVLK